jgi:uncharacterized protein (DUF2336 family)
MADTPAFIGKATASGDGGGLEMSGPRRVLLKRLMDVVALPTSRGNSQDRAIAGDLLLELLADADQAARALCAVRLRDMSQAPKRLLRFLATDHPDVACDLIAENRGFDDDDLAYIVRKGQRDHWLAAARRFDIGTPVTTALAETRDPVAIAALLQNAQPRLSERAIDLIVSCSRDAPELTPMILQREEVRPAHALAMFWWCEAPERRTILLRFSAERTLLIDGCSDVFREAVKSTAQDPVLQKALQVVERRQRNRAALASSRHTSLEGAVDAAAASGLSPAMVEELSHLAGIRAITGERIFKDAGGEGVAVLCKATGLKRPYLRQLRLAGGRTVEAGDPDYERVLEAYETLAVAKAQTVLRYWDWRLGHAFSPDAAEVDPRSPVASLAAE